MPQLVLEKICRSYPAGEQPVEALRGVSCTFAQGEYAAIIGASGSGKSTLMNILGCLDLPTSGCYRIDGDDTAKLSARQLCRLRNREIGFIFQSFNLIGTMTALENVELPLMYRGLPKKKRRELAMAALEQVGLASRLHHLPSRMSGGQQQRTAIARAVAAKPPILLADEPTGNLDSAAGRSVMRLLTGLHQNGHTLLLITHDPRIAASAPRVLELSDGRLVSDSGGSKRYV